MKWLLLCSALLWSNPDWVLQGQSDEYSYPRFLSASGSSTKSMAEADDLARAGIAKQLKSQISSRLKDIQMDWQNGASSEEQTVSQTRVTSQLSLLGAKIAERFAEKSSFHALAVFDVQEAFAKLALELTSEESLQDSLARILLEGPKENDKDFREASKLLMNSLSHSRNLWMKQALLRPVEAGLAPTLSSTLISGIKEIWKLYSWKEGVLLFNNLPLSSAVMVLRGKSWSQEQTNALGQVPSGIDSAFVPGFSWASVKIPNSSKKDTLLQELPQKAFLDGQQISSSWSNVIPSSKAMSFVSNCKKMLLGTKVFHKCEITALDGEWEGKKQKATASSAKIALEKTWKAWQLRSR